MALQAAIEGIGVLLANNPLSANDIENGTLVRPFGDMQTANNITYYLVYPKRNLKDPNVRKFCQWMRKMMT
jgi:LysR family glycine cleavage system transcriptional activator